MDEEILLKAIHAEIQARNAYELLAGRIEAESGKRAMSAIAKEEEEHRLTLANWYRKLTGRDYEYDPGIKAGPDLAFIKASAFRYTDGLEALKLALGAEDDAIAFYTEAVENTDVRGDRHILKILLKFEKKHKKLLTKEIYNMEKSNHWNLRKN